MLRETTADKFNLPQGPAVHLYNLWTRVYYSILEGCPWCLEVQ
uniref:Uncharacterized protein n=1 Tax=Lepeophtheirus salmonis TaxID=72036 RepID=A0A0K2UMT1_LEPSM